MPEVQINKENCITESSSRRYFLFLTADLFSASKNIDDPKYNEALHNTCYSWRYRGYCRYSSECRYIHEDLSSISVLYDLDSPRILTDTISSHKPASDTTESAISALSAVSHIPIDFLLILGTYSSKFFAKHVFPAAWRIMAYLS